MMFFASFGDVIVCGSSPALPAEKTIASCWLPGRVPSASRTSASSTREFSMYPAPVPSPVCHDAFHASAPRFTASKASRGSVSLGCGESELIPLVAMRLAPGATPAP
jgi:hypothetical protein